MKVAPVFPVSIKNNAINANIRKDCCLTDSCHYAGKVQIVYQTLEGLHEACPAHPGDWYLVETILPGRNTPGEPGIHRLGGKELSILIFPPQKQTEVKVSSTPEEVL